MGKSYAPISIPLIQPSRCDWNRLHGWWWRNQGVSGLLERS